MGRKLYKRPEAASSAKVPSGSAPPTSVKVSAPTPADSGGATEPNREPGWRPSAAVTVSTTGTGAAGSGSEGSGGGSAERAEGSTCCGPRREYNKILVKM